MFGLSMPEPPSVWMDGFPPFEGYCPPHGVTAFLVRECVERSSPLAGLLAGRCRITQKKPAAPCFTFAFSAMMAASFAKEDA